MNLTSLPENITNFKNLEVLNLHDNSFKLIIIIIIF